MAQGVALVVAVGETAPAPNHVWETERPGNARVHKRVVRGHGNCRVGKEGPV